MFLDAHVAVEADWAERLVAAARDPAVGAVATGVSVMGRPDCCGFGLRFRDAGLGVEWLPPPQSRPDAPPEVPLLPGCCLALRREVFEAEGRFDAGLERWGSEDSELSVRLWTGGYDLRLVPEVIVAHLFRERHPYAIDTTTILHNQLRLAVVHFDRERLARVIDRLKSAGTSPQRGRAWSTVTPSIVAAGFRDAGSGPTKTTSPVSATSYEGAR